MTLVAVAVGTLFIGLLIGLVGAGGVLLAPLLVFLTDLSLHEAMATASFSFFFTGLVGSSSYLRYGSIDRRLVIFLSLGVIPGALLGAGVNAQLSDSVLRLLLALLTFASGLNMLFRPAAKTARALPAAGLLGLGLGVGFGSALTGTGGPVLLLPVLLLLGFPALLAVGSSQVVQLPIAAFATLGFVLFGTLNVATGLALGLVQGVGVFFGAKLAHVLPAPRLRRFVAVALLGTSALLLAQTLSALSA